MASPAAVMYARRLRASRPGHRQQAISALPMRPPEYRCLGVSVHYSPHARTRQSHTRDTALPKNWRSGPTRWDPPLYHEPKAIIITAPATGRPDRVCRDARPYRPQAATPRRTGGWQDIRGFGRRHRQQLAHRVATSTTTASTRRYRCRCIITSKFTPSSQGVSQQALVMPDTERRRLDTARTSLPSSDCRLTNH